MKQIRSEKTIVIPQGIDVQINSRRVTVKNTKTGKSLARDFRHLPVTIQKTQNSANGVKKLEVSLYFGLAKQLATLRTVCSHIDNMITGVTQGYRYTMRLVYAHFPITINLVNSNKSIELKNFMGEKRVRKIDMIGATKITKSDSVKDEIRLEGPDIDEVSRSAALIHQSCLVKNKDIRRYLDGVYVSAHGPIAE